MLKILLKKQFLEFLSFFFLSGKKGAKKRKIGAIIGVSALMLYALVASVALFWLMADGLCAGYIAMGFDWVYFALMGTMAIAIGCVGSVFIAKNRLYEAKDNETLLAMPVPPAIVLLSRVISLYLFTALFTTMAFVPACIRYFTLAGITVGSFFGCLLITLVLPLLVLVVSCLLGWLIALITARIPAKNLITTLLLVAFLIGYSMLYSKVQELINFVVASGELIGATMKSKLFLFWQMGLGATGKFASTLLFVAIVVVAFALIYWLLSATFLYIVTERRTGKKAKYQEKKAKTRSAFWALLGKEGLRFFKNPMIMFNAGIGSILCFVGVGYVLIDGQLIELINAAPLAKWELASIITMIMLFIVSSNMISASSVSLEGENLWLLRSMPIKTETILTVKTAFHFLYTVLPMTVAQAALCVLFKIPFWLFLVTWAMLTVSAALLALAGLIVNLKLPNMHWTNEMVAVKQSLSTLIAMFLGWGIAALALGGHFWFGIDIGAWYFLVVTAIFAVASVGCVVWLKKRGVTVFENI